MFGAVHPLTLSSPPRSVKGIPISGIMLVFLDHFGRAITAVVGG
jgi:hypothetical protein